MSQRQYDIEEQFHLLGGNDLADKVRELEAIKDKLFEERDYSLEWKLKYHKAMDEWATAYNELRATVEKLWVL